MMESPVEKEHNKKTIQDPDMRSHWEKGVRCLKSLTNVSTFTHSPIEGVLSEYWRVVILVDYIDNEFHGLLGCDALIQCMGPQL